MGQIVTSAEVTPYIKTAGGSLRGDNESFVDRLIDAAEGFVQRHVQRKLAPEPALTGDPPQDTGNPVAKTFPVRRQGYIRVPDLRTVTSITLGGATLEDGLGYSIDFPETHYGREPATHVDVIGDVWVYGRQSTPLVITGRWGWNPVPPEIKDVICTLVARMFAERDAKMADQVQVGLEGTVFNYFKALPARSQQVIEDLRVPKFAFV